MKIQNLRIKAIGLAVLLALVPFSLAMAQSDMTETEEANEALVREFFENVFMTGDMAMVDQYIAPVIIEHEGVDDPAGEEIPVEVLGEMFGGMTTAVPDFSVEIIDIIAEGDKVAVLMTWTGTHTGEFMGMPATGNEIAIPVFDLFRIEDGKIVEHWGVTDNLAFMTQFGMMPMPEME